ncbi:MAG TPA: alpha/beta hydrolase, partial [Alphaproteobacteria bacterium]|nr:alpha/beta hydrolase [Alphaproteobacteria bacterium]
MPHARVNGVELYYEVDGPEDGPPLVLVMGYGTQMTSWPHQFHQYLCKAGMRVIRFDNRDVGLSQKFDGVVPDIKAVMTAVGAGATPDI